jgi:hypothetical protein
MMLRAFAISLLIAIPPAALNAQRMSSSGHFSPARSGSSFHGNSGNFAGRRSLAYPVGFFPAFYDDALDAGYPVASQPPLIVMQSPPAQEHSRQAVSTPMQPLMIELQGGHYVRISGDGDSRSEMIDGGVAQSDSTSGPGVKAPSEAPVAILVYRDGHQQEVSDYTIADGNLYARGNLYTDGAWTRKIELSELNLSKTIKTNQSRGIRFLLPNASNEVIVGP